MCSSVAAATVGRTGVSAFIVCAILAAVQGGRHDCDDGCAPMWEYPAPSIDSVVRVAGEAAYLKCRAFGVPRPQVSWLKDGKHLVNAGKKLDIHRWSLTLSDLLPQDSGIYTCVAENQLGYIRWNYYLRVHDSIADSMLEHAGWPANVTTYEGRTAVFECFVTSDESSRSTITWLRVQQNDSASADHREGDIVLKHSVHTGPDTLTLGNVSLEDAGQYTCIVRSPGQVIRRTVWLNVLPKNGLDDAGFDFSNPRVQGVRDRNTDRRPGPTSFLRGVSAAVGTVFGFVGLGMVLVCVSTIYRGWGRHACDGRATSREDEEKVTVEL